MNRLARIGGFPVLLAAVLVLWLRFEPLSSRDTSFVMEVTLTSRTTREGWLRFNCGSGWNFENTRAFWIVEGAEPRTYRVPLPAGDFKFFEIMSLKDADTQRLSAARILDADGNTVANVSVPAESPDAALLNFALDHAVHLPAPRERSWMASAFEFALITAVLSLLGLTLEKRGATFRSLLATAARAWRARAQAHPRTTLLVAALVAVAASCHPVVFFGRSFLSPQNGTLCLYDRQPTLPGMKAGRIDEWSNTDVYATLWAHLPYSIVTREAVLRDHVLPLWNRYDMCGVSLLGQGQSMPGDPLFWIAVVANGAAWAWDIRFLVSKVIFAFGIGLLVWKSARHLGVASLVAFSSAFIGFFSYRFDHPAFFSVCWSPWILLCWLNAAQPASLRVAAKWAFGLLAANWLELNSGTAKEASMLLLGMNATGALAVFLTVKPWSQRAKRFAIMGAGCLAFLAISAPVWIVFLDALRHGFTPYDHPASYQLTPGIALGLFDDLFYREAMLNEWHVAPALNFLALLGVLWALADVHRLRAEPAAFAAALAALPMLAMVFGIVPPGVINRLPFFKNIMHVDNTFTCVLIVQLFVVAGAGLRHCIETMSDRPGWTGNWRRTIAAITLLALLYLGTVQAMPRFDTFAITFRHAIRLSRFFLGYAAVLFAGIVLLPWLVRRGVLRIGSPLANLFCALLCLAAFHFRHGMWLDTKFDIYAMNPQPRADLHAHSPAVDLVRSRQSEPARAAGFGAIMRPGFNTVLGLESPVGADAVLTAFYAEWFHAIGLERDSMWTLESRKTQLPELRPIFDAMNVRYYFGSHEDAAEPTPGLEKIASADLEVFESKSAWPRAFFTDRVSQYRDPVTLAEWIKHGDGMPFAAVQAGEPDAPAPTSSQRDRRIVAAEKYRLTSNATSFTIDAPAAGVVVLNEGFVEDNFRARINGEPAPVFRVNHIFRGVSVPAAGTYCIEMEYWPRPLTPALFVSLAGIVFTLGAAIALRFGPRPATSA
jgi:hypothetical protein